MEVLTLGQSAATIDFGGALTWFAGIIAVLVTAGIIAACGFAWQAAMALISIKNDIKGIRKDMHRLRDDVDDHDGWIRDLQGKPRRKTKREQEEEILES